MKCNPTIYIYGNIIIFFSSLYTKNIMEENKWIIGGKDVRKKIKKNNEKDKIKYLSQGAYGCVFYPGFDCEGDLQSKKYITKLEVKKKSVINEFDIGEHIRNNIKNYNTMFAPILSYCPILVSKINKRSVTECDLIRKKDKILYSTKIRYVGQKTLEPYLYSLLEEKKDSSFFNKQLFETHIYLTNSMEKLIQNKIVHFDMKENNILYDNKQHLPIIIDFGLSFRIDLLKSDIAYRKAFFIFVSTCTWWCLEISIISFVVFKTYNRYNSSFSNKKMKISSSWMKDTIDMNHLLDIVDDYYNNNYNIILISKYWGKEVEISKQKWKDYITNTLYTKDNSGEYTKKTGEEIVKAFMQSWDTWDMFALSFIYLSFLHILCIDCFKDYQDFLVDYILAVPNERINISDYYNNLVLFSEKYAEVDSFNFNRDEYIQQSKNNKKNVNEFEQKINQMVRN